MNLQPALPFNLIKDAVEAISPIAINKRQLLENLTRVSVPSILADADMIRRVLINLLENAIKFTPPPGVIQVGAVPEGNQVLFWVEDSGPGIPAAELENIFKKLTRLGVDEVPTRLWFGIGILSPGSNRACRANLGYQRSGFGCKVPVHNSPSPIKLNYKKVMYAAN